MTKGYYFAKFILALIIAYVITGLTVIITAFFSYKLSLGDMVIEVLVKAIYVISTFAGAFYFSHKVKQKRLLYGCLIGVFYCLVILVVNMIVAGIGTAFSKEMLGTFCICVIGGIIGGFLG